MFRIIYNKKTKKWFWLKIFKSWKFSKKKKVHENKKSPKWRWLGEDVSPVMDLEPPFSILGSRIVDHVSPLLLLLRGSPRLLGSRLRTSPHDRRPHRQLPTAGWRCSVATARHVAWQPEKHADQRHVVVAQQRFGADRRERFQKRGTSQL